MSEQNNTANDYAVAKVLNERVVAIFALVAYYHGDLQDLTDINRSYVLMVNELKKLYDKNSELSGIKDNICWRTFGTIDAIDPYTLHEYSDDYRNHGNDHISKVNSLCVVADKEKPDFTTEQQKILDEVKKNVTAFAEDWLIPEYTFEITEAGVLLVNGVEGVMNVNKVNASSTIDEILNEAKAKPNTTFLPNLKEHRLKRGLRTALAEVGFTGPIEKLFMPVMDNQRGIHFRPQVTRAQANKEKIELTALDEKLKHLGAETVFEIYNIAS